MKEVFFVHYRFVALGTRLRSGLALLQMCRVGKYWHIELAVLAVFWFFVAFVLVFLVFIGGKFFLAVFACFHAMEFFLMFLLEIDVVHLSTCGTFFDVATTVAKMSGDFTFRKLLQTIITALQSLTRHRFRISFKLLKNYISSKHQPF